MKVFKLVCMAIIAMSCSRGSQDAIQSTSDDGANKILKYELSEEFALTLEETSTFTTSLQVIEKDGQELLVFADFKNRDRIFLFDIATGDMIERIKFELEGPNGIGSMNGFYYLNRDSIFIVNSFLYKVYQVDSKGEIVRRFDLKTSDGSFSILPHPSTQSITGIIGNELFIKGIGEKNPFHKDYYNDLLIAQRLNIVDGKIENGIAFPQKYHNNFFHIFNSIEYYQSLGDSKIYHSFPSEDEVFIYDENFNLINSVKVSHSKVSPIGPLKESEINSDKGHFLFYSGGQYREVLIDPIKNLLYRVITIPPVSLEQFSNYKELKSHLRKGVVIYNLSNNKILGEAIFDTEEVDLFAMFFVGKKGLYISKEDPVENMVRFYLLSFES